MNKAVALSATAGASASLAKTGAANGYQAPAVQKAFQVLNAVARSRNGIGLSQLAQDLGFSKSTTHGLIRALKNAGAISHHKRGKKLCIGPAILELVFMNWNYFQLQETAQPILDNLRDRIDETVILGGLTRYAGLIMAHAETRQPLKISAPPGTEIPLLAGAVGKVFLSHFTEAEAAAIIADHGLEHYTQQSIVDATDYLAEVAQVRHRHYALDDEEYLPGVRAAAVSLGDHRGLVLALWVVGFTSGMGNGKLERIVPEMLLAAGELKQRLMGLAQGAFFAGH